MFYFRTSQILELFDEAPDDGANWGNAVSKLEEIKDSDSSDEDEPERPKFDRVDTGLPVGITKNQTVSHSGTLQQRVKKKISLNSKKSFKSVKVNKVM